MPSCSFLTHNAFPAPSAWTLCQSVHPPALLQSGDGSDIPRQTRHSDPGKRGTGAVERDDARLMPDGVAAAGTSCDSCAEGSGLLRCSANSDQQAYQLSVPRLPVNMAVVALSARSGLICSHQPASVMTIEPGVTCLSSVLPGCLGATVVIQCCSQTARYCCFCSNSAGSSCTDRSEAGSTWRIFASLISSPACWPGRRLVQTIRCCSALNPLRCFLNIANSQGGGSPDVSRPFAAS